MELSFAAKPCTKPAKTITLFNCRSCSKLCPSGSTAVTCWPAWWRLVFARFTQITTHDDSCCPARSLRGSRYHVACYQHSLLRSTPRSSFTTHLRINAIFSCFLFRRFMRDSRNSHLADLQYSSAHFMLLYFIGRCMRFCVVRAMQAYYIWIYATRPRSRLAFSMYQSRGGGWGLLGTWPEHNLHAS